MDSLLQENLSTTMQPFYIPTERCKHGMLKVLAVDQVVGIIKEV